MTENQASFICFILTVIAFFTICIWLVVLDIAQAVMRYVRWRMPR